MSLHSRRDFLKTAAAASAGVAFAGVGSFAAEKGKAKRREKKASAKVVGANERVRIAVVGIGGRGQAHISEFAAMPGVEITYLVDPDSRFFASRSKRVEESGTKPKCVQDIRKALDNKELNAISVATCNHWHSLATVWACQAGKDVYVEKPCSHNVFEGRKCVEAARKYGRIVAHGTQGRASRSWAHVVAAIKSGKYGKLLVSKAYASKVRWSIGFKEPKEPPKEFDFNIWLGPAPEQPYHENIVHYNWHWFWDFGNGEIGNQGVHQMDIARWGIPGGTLPKSVISMGCRYVDEPDRGFRDQGQTPNMQLAVMDFGGPLLVFEVRGLNDKKGPGPKRYKSHVDNEFYLEEGAIKGGKFYPKGKSEGEPLVKVDFKAPGSDHFGNFIDCVRSRKAEDLNADILDAHLSAACCHLPNISYRLGREVPFTEKPTALRDNEHVLASVAAIEDQLVGALGMELTKFTYTIGPKLAFDPQAEQFVDNEQANKLLTRPYRKPFVVPETV